MEEGRNDINMIEPMNLKEVEEILVNEYGIEPKKRILADKDWLYFDTPRGECFICLSNYHKSIYDGAEYLYLGYNYPATKYGRSGGSTGAHNYQEFREFMWRFMDAKPQGQVQMRLF